MNELEVKTIKLTPASVDFNHEEIEKELDDSLAKFDGITFTEEKASEARKVRAYLNKGRIAVDDYRKSTKKELTKSVTKFEDKCKNLTKKFDEVIEPIDVQISAFTEKRKKDKLKQIETIREDLIKEHSLGIEYHERVVIEDEYLNVSTSIKQITGSIEFQIKQLKFEQEKLESDKQTISMSVKLANAENQLSLSENAYIRLLDFNEVDEVINQIDIDASREVFAREDAARREKEQKERLERMEKERAEQEEKERLAKLKVDEMESQMEDVFEKREKENDLSYIDDIASDFMAQGRVFDEESRKVKSVVEDIPDVDLSIPNIPFYEDETTEETFKANWEITGTINQITKLERFMIDNGIEWSVK